jgi:hypothetical protein
VTTTLQLPVAIISQNAVSGQCQHRRLHVQVALAPRRRP